MSDVPMTPRSSDVPPTKMHYEIGELGHTDFRMMARRLSHFAPGGRLVMLPRAEFEALQSRAEEAERNLDAIRRRCRVVYWPQEVGRYPIEHNMAARKDQWGAIVAELTAATLEET